MSPPKSVRAMLSRRSFLQLAGVGAAAVATRSFADVPGAAQNQVTLPPLQARTEAVEKPEPAGLPAEQRVGFAVVGLGHIALGRVLPGLVHSKNARVTALVSGSTEKARKVARQYGVPENRIYSYADFEKLGSDEACRAVYIALPNGLHAEYTQRAAQAKRDVFCEKPMAISVAEGERMVAACRQAGVKLMIGYRSQYEPLDRAIQKMVRRQELGELREFVSANSQNQGDPGQWRLNRRLAGGGPIMDLGIYCLNAARFLSGAEPVEVWASSFQPKDDARFREVEATTQFGLRFPNGFSAIATCSYDSHRSQFLRLQGTRGWAALDPAFAYDNLALRMGRVHEQADEVDQPMLRPADQFAIEIDHFAECILTGREPLTRGEEGLQDLRIIDAIQRSARERAPVALTAPTQSIRGPELPESD